jgi:hypothetical protein
MPHLKRLDVAAKGPLFVVSVRKARRAKDLKKMVAS